MTDIKRRWFETVRTLRGAARGRSLWVCCLTLALACIVFYISEQMRTVYIRDGETTTLRYTLRRVRRSSYEVPGASTCPTHPLPGRKIARPGKALLCLHVLMHCPQAHGCACPRGFQRA